MPWHTQVSLGTSKSRQIHLTDTTEQNERLIFNTQIFMTLLSGGLCEFCASTLILLSYRSALMANINQGICSSILAINGICVSIASYFIYGERMYAIQLIGIAVMTIAITIIVAYQHEKYIIGPYHQAIRNYWYEWFQQQDGNPSFALACSILYAVAAVIFITIEAMITKHLGNKGVPGDKSGLCYVFFEGCIGTVCLLIYSCMGHGMYDLTLFHVLWMFFAGLLATTGLVAQNYALSKGLAGGVLAVSSLSVALQTLAGQMILN